MITSGLEDYIELIYNSISNNKEIKAIDISHAFNISRPAVSEALIRLMDMDLIIYEGRKGIKITPKGIVEAKKIINKHNILYRFFKEVLGVEDELADKNACKIEHVIDEELLSKLDKFYFYAEENNIAEGFLKNDRQS